MLDDFDYLKTVLDSNSFFWFCALSGSGMFVIQLLMNLVGIGDHEDVYVNNESDATKFNWLSRQPMTGFLMMFGWTALTCQKEFNIDGFLCLVIALSVGIMAAFATGSIFQLVKKLHSSGDIFKIDDAVGKEAIVYQRIPKNGIGKITILINGFTSEIDAISLNHTEVPSFARVQVIKKADNKTVVVTTI